MFKKANLSKYALVKSPRSKLTSWGGVFLLILIVCLCAVCYAQSNANAISSDSNDTPTGEAYDFYAGDNGSGQIPSSLPFGTFTTGSGAISGLEPSITLQGGGGYSAADTTRIDDDYVAWGEKTTWMGNDTNASQCYFKVPAISGYKITSVTAKAYDWDPVGVLGAEIQFRNSPTGTKLVDTTYYLSKTAYTNCKWINANSYTGDVYVCIYGCGILTCGIKNVGVTYEQTGPTVSVTSSDENHQDFSVQKYESGEPSGNPVKVESITDGFNEGDAVLLYTTGVLCHYSSSTISDENLIRTFTAEGEDYYRLFSWTINGTVYHVGATCRVDIGSSGTYTFVASYEEVPYAIYGKVYEDDGETPISGAKVKFNHVGGVEPVVNASNDMKYEDTTLADGSYSLLVWKGEYGNITVTKDTYVEEFSGNHDATNYVSPINPNLTKIGEDVTFTSSDTGHDHFETQYYLNGSPTGPVKTEKLINSKRLPKTSTLSFTEEGTIQYEYIYVDTQTYTYTATIKPCGIRGYRVSGWTIDSTPYSVDDDVPVITISEESTHTISVTYELASTEFFVTPYMFDPGFSWLEVMYCKVGQWPIVRYMHFFSDDIPAGASYKVDWLNNLVIDYDWDTTNAEGDQYVVISAVPTENYELLYWSGSFGFPIIPWQTYTVEAGENYVFHPNFAKMLGHVNAEVSGKGSGSFYIKYYEAGEEVYEEYTNVLDADAFAGIKFDIDDKNLVTIYAKYDVESGKLIDNGEDNYIVVAAVANEGSQFAGWTINGEQITEPKNYTVEGYNSYKGLAAFDLVPQPGPVPGPDPVDPVNPDDPGNINNPANTSDYIFSWALDLAIIALAFGALMYRRKTTK